ncbi:MAG TPA: CrcB family protein [Bacillota bacterium]|nr:CrcB family protein [Bacillota bacterium]
MILFATAAGGFLGSIARYYCSLFFKKPGVNTWMVNVLGSILLGIITRMFVQDDLSLILFSFIGVGFCGAFTTFSTFGYETTQFILQKRYVRAFGYVSTMIIVSFSMVYFIVTF